MIDGFPRRNTACCFLIPLLLAGCAIHPLGPLDKAPENRAKKLTGYREFALGDLHQQPPVRGQGGGTRGRGVYVRDWDLLVKAGKAPVVGNALYTWSDFDKDLAALKRIGVTHYRFSIEWARVEPRPGRYNEEAVRGYARMCRKLKEAGIEPVVTLWHFDFPAWLTDAGAAPKRTGCIPGRVNAGRPMWKMVRATAPYAGYYAPKTSPTASAHRLHHRPLAPLPHPRFQGLQGGHHRQRRHVPRCGRHHQTSETLGQGAERGGASMVEARSARSRRADLQHRDALQLRPSRQDPDVCDIIGFNDYYSQRTGPVKFPLGGNEARAQLRHDGVVHRSQAMGKQIRYVGKRYDKPMMITENGIATKNEEKRHRYLEDHVEQVRKAMDEEV